MKTLTLKFKRSILENVNDMEEKIKSDQKENDVIIPKQKNTEISSEKKKENH